MSEFVVHKTTLDSDELNYLVPSEAMVTGGFSAGNPAYAYAVNAILHETSLVVTALAKNMGVVTPATSLDDMKAAITSYLVAIKPTAATTADKVSQSFTFKVNGATDSFNGIAPRTLGMIYAPTAAGSNGQLLTSTGGTPTWLIGSKGNDTVPVYYSADANTFTICKLYAGGTAVTLNNASKAANTASFYAPTASGSKGQLLISKGANSAPSWLDSSKGDATTPIYYSNNTNTFMTCDPYAGGTRVTLNGTSVAGDDCSIYAPTSTTASNETGQIYEVMLCTNNIPKFVLAAVTNVTHDSGVLQSKKIIYGIDSSGVITTSGLYAHYSHELINDNSTGVTCKYVITSDTSHLFSARTWTWSTTGFASGNGVVMTLSISNLNAKKLSIAGTVEATTFNATSDIRKKKNVKDYTPSGSILDLPVKEFDMKDDNSHHVGCIAQDLQQIAPELVHEDKDGYLTIEETKLVYLLLDEVKKLRKEIDELKGTK